jgi:hypothetical protein
MFRFAKNQQTGEPILIFIRHGVPARGARPDTAPSERTICPYKARNRDTVPPYFRRPPTEPLFRRV